MAAAFCSYQERISDERQVVDAHLEGVGQGQRHLDGRVGVVALAHVEQPGDAVDGAQVLVVEAVLAAGQGQDDRVGGGLLHEPGVVVAARLGAVAAAHQEEVADLAGLDQLDDLLGVRRARRCA